MNWREPKCINGLRQDGIKKEQVRKPTLLVRETGLEPVRDYHTPLKRARLPIPPLSRVLDKYSTKSVICQ